MTILGDSVGANGCSPEEKEAISQAQGRSQKVASHLRWPGRLRLASLAFGEASSDCVGLKATGRLLQDAVRWKEHPSK
ncbi:hypothetical protein LH53_05225 [Mesotoga sp. TolDC]|nr:hypothetical protein LH53_05225 [Mesotoga sp. TolDC]